MLITEATRVRLGDARLCFETRPPVPLKGKRVQVALWAPVGVIAEEPPPVDGRRATSVAD